MTVRRGHGAVADQAERCACLRGPTTGVPQNGGLLLVRDVWSECPARTEPYGESAVGTPRRGLDVYDPTTGEIRSGTTDELCKKLQRALKAEIDEAAWSTLYSTVSRPFDPPSTGRIAVKVINHYGDEVLKVYEIGYAEP